MQINKKSIAIIIFSLCALGGALYYYAGRIETKNSYNPSVTQQKNDVKTENRTTKTESQTELQQTVIPAVPETKPGFKKVKSNTKQVAFSFDIPENWFAETRNESGKMDEKTFRIFVDEYYGSYISPADAKAMSYTKLVEEISLLPSISVASRDSISFTDTSWEQIDFYVEDEAVARQNFQELLKDKSIKLTKTTIDGKEASMLQHPLDKDDNGKPIVTKGGTGGKEYYFFFPEIKQALVIKKQALDDRGLGLEEGFENILNTLKIQTQI